MIIEKICRRFKKHTYEIYLHRVIKKLSIKYLYTSSEILYAYNKLYKPFDISIMALVKTLKKNNDRSLLLRINHLLDYL